MGENNHQITRLWDRSAGSAERPLRRPNDMSRSFDRNSTNDSRQNTSLNSSSSTEEDILSKSKLSVNAKEWYPPNYSVNVVTTDTPRSSAQARLNKIKMQASEPSLENDIKNESEHFDEDNRDLETLQDMIGTLIGDPGSYDKLLEKFMKILHPYHDDIDMISVTADMICDHALQNSNFLYNAARLCKRIGDEHPYFRSALHLICKKKVDRSSFDHNLALFLAELFMQLNYDNLYGEFVIKTVKTVLSLGGVDNVKSVCKVLKLMGKWLDSNYSQALDEIFNQLEKVKVVLPESAVNLINSVITLRASKWGESQSSPTSSNINLDVQPYDGPIFYGPDGKELTEEEKQFLAEFNYDSDADDELWDTNPEMGEEIQAAYRQFVRQKNSLHFRRD